MKKIFIFLSLCLFISCDKNDVSTEKDPENIIGTGAFNFEEHQKTLNVFYHVPQGDASVMPILFVFHGAGRNATEYRNAWIAKANEKKVIVVVPEFSENTFPGGDAYNLGNVFIDGDHPIPETLNEESEWTFSLIETLFNKVKSLTRNSASNYDIYGHSAGAQFAHRFLMIKPNARINNMVATASGWYTMPDNTIEFPYGIQNSPIENIAASNYFSKKLFIQIGVLDNDPNAPSLRHNATVDMQGDNRYDRAFYFYNQSQNIAQNKGENFNWEIIETPNAAHDFELTIIQAADLLY